MKTVRNYQRRATECRAFAKNARDEEERHQLLEMAKTLESLALKSEMKAIQQRLPTHDQHRQRHGLKTSIVSKVVQGSHSDKLGF
jgi:citrate synthase